MTTMQSKNPLMGKAQSGGGGDFSKTEIPSADVHDARIVALVDLGSHQESFQGGHAEWKRGLYVVFELDEEMTGFKGTNHVVGVKYTLSFHEKANLRKLAENLLNDGNAYAADAAVDYTRLLGQPCAVQISHESGKGDKADRTYVRVKGVSSVPKKRREQVFAPKRELAKWFVGVNPLNDLPDYLPRIYGEKVEDVVRRCRELTASSSSAASEQTEPDNGNDEDTPF